MIPERVRNVALVGHGGSGKTSLAEALLFVGGAIKRKGSIGQGTTVFDYEPEEIDRGISLSLAVATVEWKGTRINLIDTPGASDFVGDARSGLRAADLALFVVSAVDGVEVQTEQLWRAADEEGIPRAIVINKLDRDRASYQRVLEELRHSFGKSIAPIQVPIGSESSLRGLVRVATERAYEYEDGSVTGKQVDLPSEVEDLVHTAHVGLVETVVETDDEMMEAYFEGKEPTREQIVDVVHRGIMSGEISPVLVASAEKLIGIDLLLDFFIDYGPNPLERALPPLAGGEALEPSTDGPVLAYVFKTVSDPFVGRVSLFRTFTGTVKADQELELARGGNVRLHNLFKLQGKDHEDVGELPAGGIGAVAKVEDLHPGDTLRSPDVATVIHPVSYPRPAAELAISPHSHHDEEKLSTALRRIEESDPTIRVERRAETGQTILAGLGDTHLDVTLARIRRMFGVEVDASLPLIPYRETITATAEAEGKHKKQTGGRGQFGVAFVRFAPLPRGSGYEFIDSVKGGSVPRGFIPAVDKGIQEALERGVLAGYPVVDISAELYDGKYHSVDSDEMSFRMAGIQAVRDAAPRLRPVLLEPIMAMVVRVPEEYTGDIMGDINAKRGRVLGMDTDGGVRVIEAHVPMSEVQRYAVDLRSMTSGRGTFEVEFDHYEEVPHHEAQQIIAASQKAED
ncbi:MAG: elongation factor G [Actinobacteria bacterium]|nr:elongation factor G [Actinomycetota bacterium]